MQLRYWTRCVGHGEFRACEEVCLCPPVSTGKDAVQLTREYETDARNVARRQAALAAARLPNLLNDALK